MNFLLGLFIGIGLSKGSRPSSGGIQFMTEEEVTESMGKYPNPFDLQDTSRADKNLQPDIMKSKNDLSANS